VTSLPEWLTVQLNEDERIARAATPGPWEQSGIGEYGWGVSFSRPGDGIEADDSDQGRADAEHIAEHDPARVLREIDAKRKTVALCVPPLVDVTGPGDTERSFVPGEGPPWGLDVLKLLALPYADRPGYREEWRP
jgi:hypothetical protein